MNASNELTQTDIESIARIMNVPHGMIETDGEVGFIDPELRSHLAEVCGGDAPIIANWFLARKRSIKLARNILRVAWILVFVLTLCWWIWGGTALLAIAIIIAGLNLWVFVAMCILPPIDTTPIQRLVDWLKTAHRAIPYYKSISDLMMKDPSTLRAKGAGRYLELKQTQTEWEQISKGDPMNAEKNAHWKLATSRLADQAVDLEKLGFSKKP